MKKKGVLLLNLGTPDSPKVPDVRKYLREFLMDEKVIDIPFIPRWLLVNLIIAPFRGPKSAKEYEKVWTPKGSPLLFHTVDLTEKVAKLLGDQYFVRFAMRYQTPSTASVLEEFRKEGIEEIKVIPLYPQYAEATTGSTIDEVNRIVSKWDKKPKLDYVKQFYDNPKLIDVIASKAKVWMEKTEYDHYLFSFHGLPERQIKKSSVNNYCQLSEKCCSKICTANKYCYRSNCYATTRAIAQKLELSEDQYSICFQSRLGKEEWIKPYAEDTLKRLAKEGKKKVLAFSPAFVADCLETTVEVGQEYKEEFLEEGGEQWDLVESLNSDDLWAECVVELAIN